MYDIALPLFENPPGISEAAFVVRGRVWRERLAVHQLLESLAGKISAETMRKLNAQLDRDKRRPEDVAKEFLQNLASR